MITEWNPSDFLCPFAQNDMLSDNHRITLPTPSPVITKVDDGLERFPAEIWLKIFQHLEINHLLTVMRICSVWRDIVKNNTSLIYTQYLQEYSSIKVIPSLPIHGSGWVSIPLEKSLRNGELLKFYFINKNGIAFYQKSPRNGGELLYYFSPDISQAFTTDQVLLSHFENICFFTPYTPSLQIRKLNVINLNNPSKNREFFVTTKNSPKNLKRTKIGCFPLSEKEIVIMATEKKITSWDISKENPECLKKVNMNKEKLLFKSNNYLIFFKKILDLNDFTTREHGISFENCKIKNYGSSFCTHNILTRDLTYFNIKNKEIKRKWLINSCKLRENDVSLQNFTDFKIKKMNHTFILFQCYAKKDLYFRKHPLMLILNTQGSVIQSIRNLTCNFLHENLFPNNCKTFSHLYGNLLIFKKPYEEVVEFWHIPTRKLLLHFNLTDILSPLNDYYTRIHDVRLSEKKFSILLFIPPNRGMLAKFQVLQINLQDKPKEGILTKIWNIFFENKKT